MVRRRWLVATMLVVVALIAVGCQRPQAQQPAAPAKPASQVPDLGGQTVRVATDATYPPFEMLDKDKNIVGYDIDLINNICQLANCKLDIKSTAWDGIFPALQKGDYDTVISGVTITAERAKTMDFSEAYMDVGQVVLVRADETRINGVDVTFTQDQEVVAAHFDLVAILGREQHPITHFHRAHVGAERDDLGPGESLAELRGCGDQDATRRAALGIGGVHLDEDAIVEHLDRQLFAVAPEFTLALAGCGHTSTVLCSTDV